MIALRVLSLSVVLALATTARAGAVVELVFAKSASEFNPQGAYLPGEIVNMEIRLADSSVGGDRLLRLVQLNFDAMDVNLNIQSFQWQFGAAGHYKDEALDSGPEGVAIAYYFVDSDELGPNPTAQTVLPGNGSAVLGATPAAVMPVLAGS